VARSEIAQACGTAEAERLGHWDSVDEWRSSAGEPGLKLVDITHWMAIPELNARDLEVP